LSGFACPGGTAGVAGVAGFCAGGCAGCAGTARVAGALERSGLFAWAGVGLPVELVGAGAGAGAAEAVGACAVPGDGTDAVVPPLPPVAGGTGTGDPGVGAPGAGPPGVGVETPPPPGAPLGAPTPGGPDPAETNIGAKPENGDDRMFGCATRGRKGSTSTGTLRSCVLGTASSRMEDCSSTVRAWIHSWADATAPAATAPT
jgi:hypothetical protein